MVMHGHESGMLAMKRSQPWVGLGLIDLQHLAMARTVYPPVFLRLSGERSKRRAKHCRRSCRRPDDIGLGLALWLEGVAPAKERAPGQ
jgi:hypothetical protein